MIRGFRLLRQNLSNIKPNNQLTEEQIKLVRGFPLGQQYLGVNPIIQQHARNNFKIIQDQSTKLKFLIEETGFPSCSDIGICMNVGTQNQSDQSAGSLHCLKNFVHMKPNFEDTVKNYEFLHQTGSHFDFNYDTTSAYLKCTFFEQDLDTMTDLLLDLAFTEKQLEGGMYQTTPKLDTMDQLMKFTAFRGKGIGMPNNGMGNALRNDNFIKFQRENITPEQTLISLANINNPEHVVKRISEKILQKYPQFLARQSSKPAVSTYYGGLSRYSNSPDQFQFGVAVPGVEFKSDKFELYSILRILLGQASSFSTGGPGKGMHSRCTLNLLHKYSCVHHAKFILNFFDTHGLFGLQIGGPHNSKIQIINATMNELRRLKEPIPLQQLERAKNILIATTYSNIERQAGRLEEMSKHVFSFGKVKLYDFQLNIRAVTAEQIKKQMLWIFSQPPTFVINGDGSSNKPSTKEPDFAKLRI